jgi:hypothetical protein
MNVQEKLRAARDRTLVFLRDKRIAYKLCFGSPAGQLVLSDLSKFCRANTSVYDPDQRLTDVAIGRHEVWLRIVQHLRLTEDQLLMLYNGQPIQAALAKLQQEDDEDV